MFEELAKTLTAQKNKSAMNESKNKVIETSKLEPTVMVSNKKTDVFAYFRTIKNDE